MPPPYGFFKQALSDGRCLVCLDDVSGVWDARQRKAVVAAVREMAIQFPHNRYLVTSRGVGYEEAPLDRTLFDHYTLLPLRDDEQATFVRHWYCQWEPDPARQESLAASLIAHLEATPLLQEQAHTPLLLACIAMLHAHGHDNDIPSHRFDLYDATVSLLINNAQASLPTPETPDTLRQRLERLAYEQHTHEFSPLSTLSQDIPGLVRFQDGTATFVHAAFQHYLAASYLERQYRERDVAAIWDELHEWLHDPCWHETIVLLLAGLSRHGSRATELVQHIIQVGEQDRFEPVLHRHLYLAARMLIPASSIALPDDVQQHIIHALLGIARSTHWREQHEAFAALSRLMGNNQVASELLALAQDEQAPPYGTQ